MEGRAKGCVDMKPSTQTSSVDWQAPWNVHRQRTVEWEEKYQHIRWYFLMLYHHTVRSTEGYPRVCPYGIHTYTYVCPYPYVHMERMLKKVLQTRCTEVWKPLLC